MICEINSQCPRQFSMKAFRSLLRDLNLDDFSTANLEDLINFISLLKQFSTHSPRKFDKFTLLRC